MSLVIRFVPPSMTVEQYDEARPNDRDVFLGSHGLLLLAGLGPAREPNRLGLPGVLDGSLTEPRPLEPRGWRA